MKLRTVIADDEPLARERLKLLLSSDGEIGTIEQCRNGKEVVTILKSHQIDLLLLDIQMPGSSGFEVIEAVGLANMPMTVFVTAHNEYAVEAFEVHALAYLVKPIERRRLEEALTRVKKRVRLQEALLARQEISFVLRALQTAAGPGPYPQRLLAKNGNTDPVVCVSAIEWIEAADYYACLHAGGKRHLLRESIKTLEAKLDPSKFVPASLRHCQYGSCAGDSPRRSNRRVGPSVDRRASAPEQDRLAEIDSHEHRLTSALADHGRGWGIGYTQVHLRVGHLSCQCCTLLLEPEVATLRPLARTIDGHRATTCGPPIASPSADLPVLARPPMFANRGHSCTNGTPCARRGCVPCATGLLLIRGADEPLPASQDGARCCSHVSRE